MSELNDLMEELLDYEMDDDDDEELNNEILELTQAKDSATDVPKIELKEWTSFENSEPMEVKDDSDTIEGKQKSDSSTSTFASSQKLASVEQAAPLFSSDLQFSNEFWQKSYATLTKVMNNTVPTTELSRAVKVEDSSSMRVNTFALNELSKIADDVSSLTISGSSNDLKDLGIVPICSNFNEQKPHKNADQHTPNVPMYEQESRPYENQNTTCANVNKEMSPQYENLQTTCIPMNANKPNPEHKPLQDKKPNTTLLSSWENTKPAASRRHRKNKRKTSTDSQSQGFAKDKELKRGQTIFHTKRNIPSLMSIQILPPMEPEVQMRPINNQAKLNKIAPPFIIAALPDGGQSSRKVLINPNFRGFSYTATSSDVKSAPNIRKDESLDIRDGLKRNLPDEDLRNYIRKRQKPISYEVNHSEVIQADSFGMENDESDELKQYRMEIEKQKIQREKVQREKEFHRLQVGVDAYNEDLCRI